MGNEANRADVTVIGCGLAGMAAAIHLAKAGCRVLCIGPESQTREPVGESLDWSAPALLETLGLPMERLISENFATYKRKVTVKLSDGSVRHYVPREQLGRPPYNIELRTLHVDRVQLDAALRQIMRNEGVALAADRVVEVERNGQRIGAVKTALGQQISTPWFIDASGSVASLFPRAFQLRAFDYGPRKVAIWTYFNVSDSVEGTTLYMDGEPAYMEWIWEIPIHRNVIGVGYVAAGDAIRNKREQGLSVEDIFRERLARLPRFSELLSHAGTLSPRVTSFQCRVYKQLAGPNWVIAGESASMVDPMTSNGVTAALRHAAEASALIVGSLHRTRLPYMARTMYTRRIVDINRFFNCGIEKVIYDRYIRDRFGLLTAGHLYTVPAWVLNAVYARIRAERITSTLLFGAVLDGFRIAGAILSFLCRKLRRYRGGVA